MYPFNYHRPRFIEDTKYNFGMQVVPSTGFRAGRVRPVTVGAKWTMVCAGPPGRRTLGMVGGSEKSSERLARHRASHASARFGTKQLTALIRKGSPWPDPKPQPARHTVRTFRFQAPGGTRPGAFLKWKRVSPTCFTFAARFRVRFQNIIL